jgi:lipoprotein-anchoring transpeptidase ErfK/SrfK
MLAAIVFLSIFSYALLAHQNVWGHNNTGSGPNTTTNTTPAPTVLATSTPQSLHDQAHQLLSQFHQEVAAWGQAHQYQDAYDGKSYERDYAYDQQGIGTVLDTLVNQAQSADDYQAAIDQIQSELTSLHVLESDATDQTPWNQAHSADRTMLQNYHLNSGTVVVISLAEQGMRVYQDGQLIKAFQITTGRYETPTLPGSWQVSMKQTDTTFTSSLPKSSANWYPPFPVNFLLQFHANGYMIYDDSFRRTDYGAGTNFPHSDPSGNSYAFNGTSGSVALSTTDMTWLYNKVQLHASVIIY